MGAALWGAGCGPISDLDRYIGYSAGTGGANTREEIDAALADSAVMGPRRRQRARVRFFEYLDRKFGTPRLSDAQLADLAWQNGLLCETLAPGQQRCGAIRRVPMTSTMSWWGPHAVAGRVWIVFDAVRGPDGLNDISAFDVWLAE